MSVKQLISNIIIFRKTVIGYLIIGITLVLVFILPIYYSIGQENILNNAIEKGLPEDRLNQMANIGGWIMAGITLIIVVIFTLLYYFVVYGYFLRKLRKNKKELEELNV